MQRRESLFTTKFRKWVFHCWQGGPAYFEVKTSQDSLSSIPFDAVSEKQIANLQLRKFVYKFSDYDQLGTPLDMISFEGKGYVVIYFWRKGNKEFFIIPVYTWLTEQMMSNRKSLTEERARAIGKAYSLH